MKVHFIGERIGKVEEVICPRNVAPRYDTFYRQWTRSLCGTQYGYDTSSYMTDEKSEVTCKSCLRIINF